MTDESSFFLDVQMEQKVIDACLDVKGRKDDRALKLIKDIPDQRDWVGDFLCDLVQGLSAQNQGPSEGSIFSTRTKRDAQGETITPI